MNDNSNTNEEEKKAKNISKKKQAQMNATDSYRAVTQGRSLRATCETSSGLVGKHLVPNSNVLFENSNRFSDRSQSNYVSTGRRTYAEEINQFAGPGRRIDEDRYFSAKGNWNKG